jgi:dCTP deaminase
MVLSDREIRAEIRDGAVSFNPSVENRIDSSSVDLLLHPDLLILPEPQTDTAPIIPSDPSFRVMDYLNKTSASRSLKQDHYTFDPGKMIIGKTLEYIKLPPYLAARIEGKSSLARIGLSIHITAPTVIAGFEGTLYLEMFNWGPRPIQLREGMKIAQLILERVGIPPTGGYEGQFQQQE